MEHVCQLDDRGPSWRGQHACVTDPEQVMEALTSDGFEEYRRVVARRRTHAPTGGMWQGLDPRTGAVATVIWVARPTPREAQVFIDIDRGGPGDLAGH
jgi:hypothetical protein